MENNLLKRNEIITTLIAALEPLDYVYAMWQSGSAAFNRIDQWSDIDITIDVEDHMVKDLFKIIDETLEKLSNIEYTHECELSISPGSHQKIYKLQKTSKFLIIEITAVKHSVEEKIFEKEIHGDVLVEFDKKEVTKNRDVNKDAILEQINEQLKLIENLFNLYHFLAEKELNRGNFIEAISLYNNFSLGFLVDALRIKYTSYRYGFETKHIYYDFPKDIVKKLEPFYFIKDSTDLKTKNEAAINWFNEVMEEIQNITKEELISQI